MHVRNSSAARFWAGGVHSYPDKPYRGNMPVSADLRQPGVHRRSMTGRALRLRSLLVAGAVLIIMASLPSPCPCQTQPAGLQTRPPIHAQRPKPPVPEQLQTNPSPGESGDSGVLPGDWAPELLDGIISSPNDSARDALLQAAFAAGPSIVPQLKAALKDDRTAEFAAQALAYIGGPEAFEILTSIVSDPRDLDLRRFYYGALAEFQVPQARDLLLAAINRSDSEPDRTVTQAAILALTVRSDAIVVPLLRRAEVEIQDPVIRDDVESAIHVIQERASYLLSPHGRDVGGSVQEAVRTYFMPELETASGNAAAGQRNSRSPGRSPSSAALNARQSYTASTARRQPLPAPAGSDDEQLSPARMEILNLVFSPAKTRALAHVSFEDASAVAYYDMVLEKRAGNWVLASVWLGTESEKPRPLQAAPVNPHGRRQQK